MTLNRVPEFDFSGPTPVMRGCAKWTPQSWSDIEKPLFVEAIRQQFDLTDADAVQLDVGPPVQSDAVGVSIAAVRRLACGPANSNDPFDVALEAAAQQALADSQASAAAGTSNCAGEGTFSFCPSALIVNRVADVTEGGLFHSDFGDLNDAAQLLRDSRLCAGSKAQTQHQTWINLPEITPEFARETTFHGTTNLGKN